MRGHWFVSIVVAAVLLAAVFALITGQVVLAAGGASCVSYWYVSYGGNSSWTLVNTDTEGLPLSDLVFSRSYNDPTDIYAHGYLDFNHDGKSDVFSAVPIGNGYYRWRYSSGAATPWINLAYDATPPDQLRFGDFNGDGYTDVFVASALGGGLYQWMYSSGGVNSFVNLAYDSTPPDQLRFGDFNGDGRTDVFVLKDAGGGNLSWNVSYSGTTNYHAINVQLTPLSEMQFGDINGDGHTDVFTTLPDNEAYDWYYSSAGSGAYQQIASQNSLGVHDVLLAGNFDPITNGIQLYHGTDVFYTTPRIFDGTWQWWYHYYQQSSLNTGDIPLAYDSTSPDQLRFADFNGDGVTDVFRLERRCDVYLPLVKR